MTRKPWKPISGFPAPPPLKLAIRPKKIAAAPTPTPPPPQSLSIHPKIIQEIYTRLQRNLKKKLSLQPFQVSVESWKSNQVFSIRVPTRPGKLWLSWKNPEKTKFFRLSWNSGIKISWKSSEIPLVHGIWFSMAVFQWPVCYFSFSFMHHTAGPWKTRILKGAI